MVFYSGVPETSRASVRGQIWQLLTARARSGAGGCGAELVALPWGRAGPGSTEVGGVGAAPGSFLWGRAVARQSQSAAASTRPLWERFFSRVERRNRAALLPPACPPRGLFNSGGFQVVRAGTQKPCPVPSGCVYPLLEAALWVRVPPVCCWSGVLWGCLLWGCPEAFPPEFGCPWRAPHPQLGLGAVGASRIVAALGSSTWSRGHPTSVSDTL